MDLDLEVKAIRNAPIFTGIDPCKMRLLACMSEQLTFGKDDYLFRAGELPDAAYVILKGEVELLAENGQGEMIIGTEGPGTMIGEVAVLCDARRLTSARAHGDIAVMRINKDCLLRMMQDNPQFSMSIAKELARRVMQVATQGIHIPTH
ncbi:cyclic nucleotide-binding domain-containing protein [Labrys neptuniae]